MANPLSGMFQSPQQSSPAAQSFSRMMNMLSMTQDPQKAMQQLAAQNPQVAQIMRLCNGKNPRDVFLAECQRRGIDPQQFLSELGVNKPSGL